MTPTSFRHEALLYGDDTEFLAGTTGFIRDGVHAGEPTLVVLNADKISRIRAALGEEAEGVIFADMAQVGANPARIIPAWVDFVQANLGRPVRGIGEPIWAERTPEELVECEGHEALLNVAFEGAGPFWLLCPYDTAHLPATVVDTAHRTHPYVAKAGTSQPTEVYLGRTAETFPFEAPLAEPPITALHLDLTTASLSALRRAVAGAAARAGLSPDRIDDAVGAVHEAAVNSLQHAGGGTARVWHEPGRFVADICDAGRLAIPLAGRIRPGADGSSPRGLWLTTQLADLVQLRTSAAGNQVRIHVSA